jgi:nucleoside-diphosphate-sugar epimerase
MTEPLRIAILGAGYIGSTLAVAAAAEGHQVWAVRRSAMASRNAVTWLQGDVANGRVVGMPDALDAVVLTIAPGAGSAGYDGTYLPGAHAAVALARATGAQSLLYTSSTGVYGGRNGDWVSEQSPLLGVGPGNEVLIDAERIIRDAAVPHMCVLRVTGIYGPGRDPRGRMRDPLHLAQRGEYWVNLAHRDDIVAALLHVLHARPTHPVLNVSDGAPATAADVCRWLAAERGDDANALTFGNDDQRSRNDQRVSSTLLQSTGWSPQFPSFREGFARGLS